MLPQDEGALVEFVPAGFDEEAKQVNLIRARQTPHEGFNKAKELIDQSIVKRVDVVMLDYTREQVAGRMQIDGSWHAMPPMDRPSGDTILATLKFLAGLKPADRRSRQEGQFRALTPETKCDLELATHGTPTGERVQLKFNRDIKSRMSINQLGMWPDMSQQLADKMNTEGLVIVSAMPAGGLTSTWQAALEHADRITRDLVAIVSKNEIETDVENIALHRFDQQAGQSPATILKKDERRHPSCWR